MNPDVQAAPGFITAFRGQYRFLSSFYDLAPFPWPDWAGTFWEAKTREHAFQASKTTDQRAIGWVMAAKDPQEAKARGRQVPLIPGWDEISRSVMLQLALRQYQLYPGMCSQLAATAPRILVEGNTWGDDYWGAVRDPRPDGSMPWWDGGDGTTWYGHNWLGRLLMMAREVLS